MARQHRRRSRSSQRWVASYARMTTLPTELAERIARMALAGITREFPCKPTHVLRSAADLRMPRRATPSFFGCFDWHSAVHAHWSLTRLLALCPAAPFASEIRAALDQSLRPESLRAELDFRRSHPHFEVPYGVAWLLALQSALELLSEGQAWAAALRPLSALAGEQLSTWLAALPCPIRAGEHSQTAFAMGLALDAARAGGQREDAMRLESRAREFYGEDRDAPLCYEPSAHDFLSPCLAEADLLARIMESDEFGAWLDDFLADDMPSPVQTVDRSSGKLAHWDGLNLSRAWMLARIADRLPREHPRQQALLDSGKSHLELGLTGLSSEHYAGSHWLGTFALYALSEVSWHMTSRC